MTTAIDALRDAIATDGYARLPGLLAARECAEIAALYAEDARFRSTVAMARYRFGQGEYRYFAAPLPAPVQRLRETLYPPLAAVANEMAAALGEARRFPGTLEAFLAQCHAAGQTRPTPLLLRYGPGDYNCLHRDLYGEIHFPLQVVIGLSRPGEDYEGGELLLVEQRPRAQSKGEAILIGQGEGIAFPVLHRPVRGARGVYRAGMRHGVSRVRRGLRLTLGIIFHDAA